MSSAIPAIVNRPDRPDGPATLDRVADREVVLGAVPASISDLLRPRRPAAVRERERVEARLRRVDAEADRRVARPRSARRSCRSGARRPTFVRPDAPRLCGRARTSARSSAGTVGRSAHGKVDATSFAETTASEPV